EDDSSQGSLGGSSPSITWHLLGLCAQDDVNIDPLVSSAPQTKCRSIVRSTENRPGPPVSKKSRTDPHSRLFGQPRKRDEPLEAWQATPALPQAVKIPASASVERQLSDHCDTSGNSRIRRAESSTPG